MKESAGRHRLATIFLVVFVDLLGFSLILPLLPYYAEQYGAGELMIGLLTASYAAAQLVGAPVLGRLSDRIGRRPVLLVSIAGTAVGFALLGVADVLGHSLGGWGVGAATANMLVLVLLFVSRVLDGLTGGNISVAQAYIADVTPPAERGKAFGLIGAAFGLGFIIGPVVGGLLGERFGFSVPAFVAMAIAGINLLAVYLFLPESVTPERRKLVGSDLLSAGGRCVRRCSDRGLGRCFRFGFCSAWLFRCFNLFLRSMRLGTRSI